MSDQGDGADDDEDSDGYEEGSLPRIVTHGTAEELEAALAAGAAVDAPSYFETTALMAAAEIGDVGKMKLLVAYGADPELLDHSNATALRRAVHRDAADSVRYLLSLGVDRGWRPKYPLRLLDLNALSLSNETREVLGGTEEAPRPLIYLNANPVIGDARSLDVLAPLVEAGEDITDASQSTQRLLLGLSDDAPFLATADEYRAWKHARRGVSHPERIDSPFWRDMVRTGARRYDAREHFDDPRDWAAEAGRAVWCFDRFGASLTALPDGRYVRIAGEHEDYYDPDFYIYNDVVVFDGNGGFEIFAYPEEVFPPTDFHTATLHGDDIFVVGGLGYTQQRRPDVTPVYRLSTQTWQFEPVPTTGEPPGWVYNHRAIYDAARRTVRVSGGDLLTANHVGGWEYVDNDGTFELDLTTFEWRRLADDADG